jgi:CubicO group peptidase (beta-lactamase class C family)
MGRDRVSWVETGAAMRILRSTIFLLLLLSPLPTAAQTLARPNPAQLGFSPQRLQRLTTTLNQYVSDDKLAGGVLLIARRGQIAYLEAFGMRDIAAHSRMRADVIFRIASQTKALVSVATMMLLEEGALLLSDPVGKYIPEFARTKVAVAKERGGYDVVAAKRPITIHDLLTHTAGINYGMSGVARAEWVAAGLEGWYFADRDEPMSSLVVRMAALPFYSQPGEQWVYGYATDVLGVVVERVAGMTLDDFLRTRILQPLRMVDTHFFLPVDKRARLATVYSAKPAGGIERAPDTGGMVSQGAYTDGPRKAFSGGAGLLSTAHDYARFLQMLLNGGELDGVRLLSRKTVELMTTDHVEKYGGPATGWSLGFQTVENLGAWAQLGTVGSYGWGGAYHSHYWVDPQEQLVVVYLTQLIPAGNIDDHNKLRALIYQALVDQPGK